MIDLESSAGELGGRLRVLVVDVDESVRRTLTSALEPEGHAVSVVADGLEGLGQTLMGRPDFILYDLRAPELDALEFLNRYRGAGGEALVIVMCGYGNHEAALAAMRAGAYDILPKPFTTAEVLLILSKAALREAHLPEQPAGPRD